MLGGTFLGFHKPFISPCLTASLARYFPYSLELAVDGMTLGFAGISKPSQIPLRASPRAHSPCLPASLARYFPYFLEVAVDGMPLCFAGISKPS